MSRMVVGDRPDKIEVLYESCGLSVVCTTSSLREADVARQP